jgi:hypothetical protein
MKMNKKGCLAFIIYFEIKLLIDSNVKFQNAKYFFSLLNLTFL